MAEDLLTCVTQCDLTSADAATCLATACQAACSAVRGDVPSFQIPVAAAIAISFFLVPLSGLFAGLTIGLLSLDKVGLRVLVEGGDPEERVHAEQILPVRQQGNLLLCTLLLGNTITNAALSILLADLTTGPIGLLASTAIILLFGEIIPQSICTRHGLRVGANCIWVVKVFIALMSPIAYPISLVLDCVLGRDIGTVYSQEEFKRLIDIHVHDPDAHAESGLTNADRRLLIGALEYKDKRAKDAMTSLEHCFMLEVRSRLNFATMLAIYKSGFTRIPVYESSRQNILGILYVKDLILVDPDDETELSAVLAFRGREVACVREDVQLDEVFRLFMSSAVHMLLVRRAAGSRPGSPAGQPGREGAPLGEVVGLITLEDVMEELIQAEIIDETDVYEDVNHRVLRRGGARADVATFLTMFEHKLHAAQLSPAELSAVAAFLVLNVEEFAPLMRYDLPLKGLISHAEILERDAPGDGHTFSSSPATNGAPRRDSLEGRGSHGLSAGEWGAARVESHELEAASGRGGFAPSTSLPLDGGNGPGDGRLVLYRRGEASDAFSLILQGKVLIRTGSEGFELELGPWSVLANRALSVDNYQPDFDAVALPPCRILRVRRAAFRAALEATSLDPVLGYQRGRLGPAPARAGPPPPPFDGVTGPSMPRSGLPLPPSPFDGVAAPPPGGTSAGGGSHLHAPPPPRPPYATSLAGARGLSSTDHASTSNTGDMPSYQAGRGGRGTPFAREQGPSSSFSTRTEELEEETASDSQPLLKGR